MLDWCVKLFFFSIIIWTIKDIRDTEHFTYNFQPSILIICTDKSSRVVRAFSKYAWCCVCIYTRSIVRSRNVFNFKYFFPSSYGDVYICVCGAKRADIIKIRFWLVKLIAERSNDKKNIIC